MRDAHPPSPAVVVGIDGSRNGVTAALWAVDEAEHRDIPLRLVYAMKPDAGATDPKDAAAAFATAETAVRQAVTAVKSTDRPVKIESAILHGAPADTLREASSSAAMLCVGAVGLAHVTGRIGSTAADLASRAHCPVAIIRHYDPSTATSAPIVVEADSSVEGEGVLQRGIEEALLRGAPLMVVSVWRPRFTDVRDGHAVAEQNRRVRAELNRRLARSIRRHPELDVHTAAVPGSLLNYLSRHAPPVQLVVVGRRRASGVAEMVGPPSYAALHDTDCSVLVCDPHSAL